jgi:hypothetical protein
MYREAKVILDKNKNVTKMGVQADGRIELHLREAGGVPPSCDFYLFTRPETVSPISHIFLIRTLATRPLFVACFRLPVGLARLLNSVR